MRNSTVIHGIGGSLKNFSKEHLGVIPHEGSIEGDAGFSLELEAGVQELTGLNGMLSPRGLEASMMRQDGPLDFLPIVQTTIEAHNNPGNETMILANSLVGTTNMHGANVKVGDSTLKVSRKTVSYLSSTLKEIEIEEEEEEEEKEVNVHNMTESEL